MRPSDFPESNITYVRPDDMEDCDSLPACRVPSPTGGVIVSCWEPDAMERDRIACGGPVWLWVHSAVQPPVSLSATSPFGACESYDEAAAQVQAERYVDLAKKDGVQAETKTAADGGAPIRGTDDPGPSLPLYWRDPVGDPPPVYKTVLLDCATYGVNTRPDYHLGWFGGSEGPSWYRAGAEPVTPAAWAELPTAETDGHDFGGDQ